MKTIYIKFIHPEDVFAIHPDYDLSPDDFIPPKICSRCGETLYIPVELPESATLTHPSGHPLAPFLKDEYKIFLGDEIKFISLGINFPNKNIKISFTEKQRLRRFQSVIYVDETYFEILIDDYSQHPIKHKCDLHADF